MNWGINIHFHNLHDHQGHKHISIASQSFLPLPLLLFVEENLYLTITLWSKYYWHHLDHGETEVQGGQEQASNPAKGKATPLMAHVRTLPRAHAPWTRRGPHGRLWALCRRMGSARAELGSGVPWPTGESWDAWCSMSQGRKLFPCPKRGRCGPGAHGELEDPLGPCPSLRARNAFNHKICSVDLYKYHIPSTAWGVSYVTFTEFEWELYGGEAAWFNLVSPWIFLETFWILCNYTICTLGLMSLFSWQNTLC